ncbi:hypothetical protein Rsub_04565 [Raphidocelis subcapitata]|uniref:AAA+ ATPase domain-containing protein n=1 Tax=Raphidocelis subcapitata TaxID=307507 RepID=A0A2V0NXV7_9CHLO|nr:hypothetical protein Rsub_04565 [Raphidocelis subcapitata]|eukprot:GBF92461.1 hypothetical protein Rsub_04565 [Raphidocelis subcapitata]
MIAARPLAPQAPCSGRGATSRSARPPRPAARARGRTALRVRALGFDFGDAGGSPPPPKPSVRVGAYQMRAASLLVFQSVLRGAVGEAFLAALAATQKYQAKASEVVGASAKLYQLLMAAGHDSWQDYVLDQVLFGRENAFARAAAQGGADARAPSMEAVAYDLDVLQDLAMPLQQLVDLTTDAAPTVGGYWASSAAAPGLRAPPAAASKQLPGAAAAAAPRAPAAAIPLNAGGGGAGGAAAAAAPISAPPTREELAAWKAAIAGHERWGAAAPLVLEYYRRHGFGITSRNSTLRWSKGAFEEASEGAEGAPAVVLSAYKQQRAELDANTLRHAAGLPAQHAIVCGPSGSGKSWMLWEGTLAAAKQQGIRLVEVTSSEFGAILDIARGCARYPRVRFILVADHLELPLRGSLLQDVCSGLSGAGGSGWPSNTLLYVGASPGSTVTPSDPLVQRAGLLLLTEPLDEEGFREALGELLGAQRAGRLTPTGAQLAAWDASGAGSPGGDEPAAAAPAAVSDAELASAIAWAKRHCGGLSLRAAGAYARLCGDGGAPAAAA